ncbi:MAG: hypothetical protein K6B52_05195 [Clostridiales bacterium]|nr:hypothetical protein [Clostridiales bacterium]
MASERTKKNSQNIITGVVAGLAVVLLAVVFLAKTGFFTTEPRTTQAETVVETEIVVASEINNEGEVVYYTMLNEYVKPKMTSHHRYPTTTQLTTEPETGDFVEITEYEQLTDVDGSLYVDVDGIPVTRVVVHTIPVTTEKETHSAPVTDENGSSVTKEDQSAAESETTDVWTPLEESTTKKTGFDLTPSVTRDDQLAKVIISQINTTRVSKGLGSLSQDTSVTLAARTNSLAMAVPSLYTPDSSYPNKYTFSTEYGGRDLFNDIAANCATAFEDDTLTQVGVGVIKSADKYYTTIIFK